MRAFLSALVLALSVSPAAMAQTGRAAIGGAVGVAGGAVITMSVVVARARFQGEYLESIDDLIHWQSVPMLLTPAVGVAFGLAGREPLKASVIGSTGGLAAGAVVGAAMGWLLSDQPEWPWAGGIIGAGVGMTVGGLAMGIREWRRGRDDGEEGSEAAVVGVRIGL